MVLRGVASEPVGQAQSAERGSHEVGVEVQVELEEEEGEEEVSDRSLS